MICGTVRRASNRRRRRTRRHGLTLAELLITIAIMSILAVAMSAMATAVQQANAYGHGYGTSTQAARVALGRIEHHIETATSSAEFPGFAIFGETIGLHAYPDTIVIWNPSGTPANAAGPPLFSELIIYCPDPAQPNALMEITIPSDTRATPALSATSTWLSELATIKASESAVKVTLLESLRTASAASGSADRGALRFVQRVLPSSSAWNDFLAGTTAWNDLPWVQDIHGSRSGLRQSWCRIEMQLIAEDPESGDGDGATIPFFGSAALYDQLTQ